FFNPVQPDLGAFLTWGVGLAGDILCHGGHLRSGRTVVPRCPTLNCYRNRLNLSSAERSPTIPRAVRVCGAMDFYYGNRSCWVTVTGNLGRNSAGYWTNSRNLIRKFTGETMNKHCSI